MAMDNSAYLVVSLMGRVLSAGPGAVTASLKSGYWMKPMGRNGNVHHF
jgi:hypothetical protein